MTPFGRTTETGHCNSIAGGKFADLKYTSNDPVSVKWEVRIADQG